MYDSEIDETLKEKCERLRSASDHKLEPNSFICIMLDGRSFSRKVKNKFEKPFDMKFVEAMNETMRYLCSQVQGCRFGYCQSDEISLVICDIPDKDNGEATSFFGYRLCKIQSIVASMATAKFNQIMLKHRMEALPDCISAADMQSICLDYVDNMPLYEFDCKAWNVPNSNDAYAWLLYRNLDCMRNSKQQAAQTYLPHKELVGLHTDEQVAKLKETKGIDWHGYDNGLKYGRVCYKTKITLDSPQYGSYERNVWTVEASEPMNEPDMKGKILEKITKSGKE